MKLSRGRPTIERLPVPGLRRARKRADVTLQTLAAKLPGKPHVTTVSQWERGKSSPSKEMTVKIAALLKCRRAELHR